MNRNEKGQVTTGVNQERRNGDTRLGIGNLSDSVLWSGLVQPTSTIQARNLSLTTPTSWLDIGSWVSKSFAAELHLSVFR